MFEADHLHLTRQIAHVVGEDVIVGTYTAGRNLFAVVDAIENPITKETALFRVRFWQLGKGYLRRSDGYDFVSGNYYDAVRRIFALDAMLMRPDTLTEDVIVAHRCGNGVYVYITETTEGRYRVRGYVHSGNTLFPLKGETRTYMSERNALSRITFFEAMSNSFARKLAGIDD